MRMSLLKVTLILLVFAAQAFGQAGVNLQAGFLNLNLDFVGSGARAKGMGNAFLAISDDINGGSWNPAGLYVHDAPQLGLGYSSLIPSGTSSLNMDAFSTTFSKTIDQTGSFSNLSELVFVAPFRLKGHKFVGSFSYSRTYDEYSSEAFNWQVPWSAFGVNRLDLESVIDDNFVDINYESVMEGGLYTINIGGGTRIYDKISMGIVANIYTGSLVLDAFQTESIDNIISQATFEQPALHVSSTRAIDSLKYSGLNFNIGLKYSGDKYFAGLLIRTPLALKVVADSTRISSVTANGNLIQDTLTVLSPKINPHLTKYELPMMVGFGLGYKVKENFLLAFDAEYRPFSDATIKIRDSLRIEPSGDNVEFFTEYDPSELFTLVNRYGTQVPIYTFKWNNIITLRLGGEYVFDTKYGLVPVRAGFGYVPVPGSTIESPTSNKTSIAYKYSLGTGIHWSQILLDVSYTFYSRDFELNATNINSITGDFWYRNHQINVSFTGYF